MVSLAQSGTHLPARSRGRTDVVVVGAGIIGLATAERLVNRGRHVTLVDHGVPGAGVSAVSGGLLRAFHLDHRTRRMAISSLHTYIRGGWRGSWPLPRRTGSLTLVDESVRDAAEFAVDDLRRFGIRASLLHAREIGERFGLVVDDTRFGVWEPQGGWVPAADVVRAVLAEVAPRACVLTDQPVEAVVADSRGVTGVRTPTGEIIEASAVVVAAGAASNALVAGVGVDLELQNRRIEYGVFACDAGTLTLPATVDTTTGAWLRATDDGAVLAGAFDTTSGVAPTVRRGTTSADLARVRRIAGGLLPVLETAPALDAVSAYDALSPTGTGAVQVWPKVPGLVAATGWNGNGFKIAPAVGGLASTRLLVGAP